MHFIDEYNQKKVSADEAVRIIKSGDWVDYGFCVTTVDALDRALAKRTDELFNVHLRGAILPKLPAVLNERMPKNISHGTLGILVVLSEN